MSARRHALRAEPPQQRAQKLRERVYVTFTALAVIMALDAHSEHLEPKTAVLTLFVSVVGILLAGFGADLVAHTVVHSAPPGRAELRHLLGVATGGLAAVATPLLLLCLAWAGVMPVQAALTAGRWVLVVTMGILAYIALRTVKIPMLQRLLLIVVLVAIGVGAVALELFAHSL